MPGGDEIRDVQRAAWAGLSAGWEKWDSVIMDQLGPVGAAMIERLDIAEDHQHLDIAAGTGEPGLSIARLLPKGRVVLTDLVAEMLDIAARRARAQGIANIETKVCSADDLPFDDATFDSVSVRFGYMFFPDVAKATSEFARAQAGRPSLLVGVGQARETRGRRSPCRQSRPRRWWRHPTPMGRTCFGALPRDMSVPCTTARGCATLSSGTSTSNS
jgi:SAM-dependent methyltransferase